MLTKITLENFKSFHERTEIDFTKTNYSFLPQNVADCGVLKGAVFVGANASGKSNVLEAIKLLLDLLFAESAMSFSLYACYYQLAKDEHQLGFSLAFDFKINETTIRYTIHYSVENRSFEEELHLNNKLYMQRRADNSATVYNSDTPAEYSEGQVNPSGLFLRTLYFNTKFQGDSILQEWMLFLSRSIFYDQSRKSYSMYGVEGIPSLYQYIKKNGVEQFNEFFEAHYFPQTIGYEQSKMDHEYSIVFVRQSGDNIVSRFPEGLESTGNRALIRMLHLFFLALSRNCMLIVDEFSSCLHNDLEELLVKYFMAHSEQSQLFLVTHSTNLLSNSILRPDQEYAVEYKENGSHVKRFSTEQPRLAQNVEKMYASGVFGGLPNYRETYSETES